MLIATLQVVILTASCDILENTAKEINIFAMDTFMSIKAYGADGETMNGIENEIRKLESAFSVTKSDSDISKLNADGVVEACDDTVKLIEESIEMCKLTNAALDITTYPVTLLWGFTTGNYRVPDRKEIEEAMKFVDCAQIKIDNNLVQIDEGVKIDLGAVAKGYTSEKICEILREKGIKSAVINLGGNVQTIGRRTDGKKWRVGVKNPFKTDENLLIVEVEDAAVVTSGNYERYFEVDGKRYCHIIDSSTGYPVDNGVASITVIGQNGLKCDALSTALLVMGKEKAIEFWKKSADFDMIIVTSDEKIFVTDGISSECTNESSIEMEIINRE